MTVRKSSQSFFATVKALVCSELAIYAFVALHELSYTHSLHFPVTPFNLFRSSHDRRIQSQTGHRLAEINPHANIFNRPTSIVERQDDYLGPRPDIDTEANLEALMEACRGSYEQYEKMLYVQDCMQFLANDQDKYYYLPPPAARASAQNPQKAEFRNADSNGNTLLSYPSYKAPNKQNTGSCSGPIIPFHTYWNGPATWRVESFVKSYLYTQNLACARLNIWVDADLNPAAKVDMLRDTLFARFQPLMDRGDIAIREWKFPSRIPIRKSEAEEQEEQEQRNRKNKGFSVEKGDQDQHYLNIMSSQKVFQPTIVSDAMRFVVLHLEGGIYLDMDMLLLRDLRPLLLSKNHSFAERWGSGTHFGDYNTAVISFPANSSLSSYLIRGAVRMGVNFHPRAIGRMLVKDKRDHELIRLEAAVFDPTWPEWDGHRKGQCTIPCLHDFDGAFSNQLGPDEWESYDGEQLKPVEVPKLGDYATKLADTDEWSAIARLASDIIKHTSTSPSLISPEDKDDEKSNYPLSPSRLESQSLAPLQPPCIELLRRSGIVSAYNSTLDKYPPTNRTLSNFFRGAWTYHIHNRWEMHPEPSSWLDVVGQAHDDFFARRRTNAYGEWWDGPGVGVYDYWPEFV